MTLRFCFFLFFFLSFQTRKGITAVNLQDFAKNVSELATRFQSLGDNLSGDNQTKAYVSIEAPPLSILPSLLQGMKKSRSDCPEEVNFDVGQVKIGIWWPIGQVK